MGTPQPRPLVAPPDFSRWLAARLYPELTLPEDSRLLCIRARSGYHLFGPDCPAEGQFVMAVRKQLNEFLDSLIGSDPAVDACMLAAHFGAPANIWRHPSDADNVSRDWVLQELRQRRIAICRHAAPTPPENRAPGQYDPSAVAPLLPANAVSAPAPKSGGYQPRHVPTPAEYREMMRNRVDTWQPGIAPLTPNQKLVMERAATTAPYLSQSGPLTAGHQSLLADIFTAMARESPAQRKMLLSWRDEALTRQQALAAQVETHWDQATGAAKQVVNDYLRDTAASVAETMGATGTFTDTATDETLSTEEVATRTREQGRDTLPIEGDDEHDGADFAHATPALATLPIIANAVMTRGRSLIGNPAEMARNLEGALKHSRSPSEAIGKLGGELGSRKLGHVDDPRYVDRYHGPDAMKRDPNGRLAEEEYKGSNSDNTAVAKDVKNNKQGSAAKNLQRAQTMTGNKAKKVGIPSNRQGGAYESGEIDMWQDVEDLQGEKGHFSIHTNTETGRVRVIERDDRGEIMKEHEGFTIDDFDVYKKAIEDAFK